jgi:putative colanic acid biosynthesis glycosyltransferase
MRILQVDVNYGQSSTGKIVQTLHREHRARGHESWVRYGRGPEVEEDFVRRIANPAEVHAHAALTRITGLTGAYSPLATRALIHDIESIQPDVVHLHELHGYYINYIEIVRHLRSKAIPVVWTFHCEFMYTGKCGHAHDCERWMAHCGRCPQKGVYPASLTFDFTSQMLAQKRAALSGWKQLVICCPSQWLADRVRRSFLGDLAIERVFNGINTEGAFYPRPSEDVRSRLGLGTSRVLLAVASNLADPAKGGDWMLKLSERMRDVPIKLVLVGLDEPIELPNVIAMPAVSDQNTLAELYSVADLLVLPSRRETFSLVCAEALACGTPVVGFSSGAPAEVAPAGYGIFVPHGDLDGLEHVIRQELFGLPTLYSREQCRQFAVERYSDTIMSESYLDVYRMALSSK